MSPEIRKNWPPQPPAAKSIGEQPRDTVKGPAFTREAWVDSATVEELRDGLHTCRANWTGMYEENKQLRATLSAYQAVVEAARRYDAACIRRDNVKEDTPEFAAAVNAVMNALADIRALLLGKAPGLVP